jgi:hypothetical protein
VLRRNVLPPNERPALRSLPPELQKQIANFCGRVPDS